MFNVITYILIIFIVLSLFVILAIILANIKKVEFISRDTFALGTICRLTIETKTGAEGEEIMEAAIKRIEQLDNKFSKFKDSSEVSLINKNSGKGKQRVSEDTYNLVKEAVRYSNISKGLYNPMLGSVVDLWSIGTDKEGVPEADNIENSRKLINCEDICFHEDTLSIELKKSGEKIDLGGIAKGYVADEIRKFLEENKVTNALIDLGGNIIAMGEKQMASPWVIGIQNPKGERGRYIGSLSIKDKSIVTSGTYERCYEDKGQIYHHIIDPRTGKPSNSDLVSVTIISNDSIEGDGLTTGLLIMGLEEGKKLVKQRKNIEAIFITKDNMVYITSGIKEKFLLLDQKFYLEYLEDDGYEKEDKNIAGL